MRGETEILLLAAIQVEPFHPSGETIVRADKDLVASNGELLNTMVGTLGLRRAIGLGQDSSTQCRTIRKFGAATSV